jgi:hypothetical protein
MFFLYNEQIIESQMFAGSFANEVGGPEEEFRDEGCFDLRRVFFFLVDEKLRVPGFGLGIYFHFIFGH